MFDDTISVESNSAPVSTVTSKNYVAEQKVSVHKVTMLVATMLVKQSSLFLCIKRCHNKKRKSDKSISVESHNASYSTVSCAKYVDEQKNFDKCDYPCCNYVSNGVKSVSMIKQNVTSKQTATST